MAYTGIGAFSYDALQALKDQLQSRMGQTRKRRALSDPTQDYNYDMSAPNDLPTPDNATPYSGGKQGGGKMDMFANIMQAIAAGASVGLSDNPSEALSRQLSQQMQRNMELRRMQNEKETQKAQQDFQRQTQATQIKAGEKEQKTAQDYGLTKQRNELDASAQQQANQISQQQTSQQIDIEAKTKLQRLSQEFEAGEALKMKTYQTEKLQQQQAGDINGIVAKSTLGALMNAVARGKVTMKAVVPIINKISNGEELDKSDSVTVDHALKTAASSGGGSVKGAVTPALTSKQNFKNENDYLNDERHLTEEVIKSALQPRFNQFTGEARPTPSPDELASQVKNAVSLYRQVSGRENVHAQGSTSAMQNFDKALSDPKMTPQQLDSAIDRSTTMSPEEKLAAKKKLKDKFKLLR